MFLLVSGIHRADVRGLKRVHLFNVFQDVLKTSPRSSPDIFWIVFYNQTRPCLVGASNTGIP